MSLPSLFLDRLQRIIPPDSFAQVLKSFEAPSFLSVRVNTLKTTKKEIEEFLKTQNILFHSVGWCEEALVLENASSRTPVIAQLIEEGRVYPQGLSSMLPVVILDPQPEERVLDLCAAPGSKTTQIASRMKNKGAIQAVEAIRGRAYKLRSVINLLGADIVSVTVADGRKFRPAEVFDRVLVDAPCSSEGRFSVVNKKSFAYWSLRKVKEMAHKQKGLLLAASRLLAPGGVLVYATCTFSPEENESVVDWFLRKTKGQFQIIPVEIPEIKTYPAILKWEEREYDPQVSHCVRVLPDEFMNGFFVAKIKRIDRI